MHKVCGGPHIRDPTSGLGVPVVLQAHTRVPAEGTEAGFGRCG